MATAVPCLSGNLGTTALTLPGYHDPVETWDVVWSELQVGGEATAGLRMICLTVRASDLGLLVSTLLAAGYQYFKAGLG